jgi:hypothetical protein
MAMNISPTATLIALGALIAACESQPSVTFVAIGSDFNVLGLTHEQSTCEAPGRLAYLTWWDGETLRGCWVRDHANIRVRFDDMDDRRIPVGEFQPTEVAHDQNLSLN